MRTKKIPYRIIDGELGIASISISELSEDQTVAIRERFGQDILTPDLIAFYDDSRDWVVMNRDHGNYQINTELAQAYLSSGKRVRSQLSQMVPECVKGFVGLLEIILRRREHEG